MSKAFPLDERIVATLTGICTSEQAAAVHAEAQGVLRDLTTQADRADVDSLSPLATGAEARKLRDQAAEHRFEADRMEASVSALSARVADLKDAEREARRQADVAAVRVVRDELADEIARDYPGIVKALADFAARIIENDRECQRVGLESAEAVGRGVPANFYQNSAPIHRIKDRAPAMATGNRLAWENTMSGMRFFALDDRLVSW